MIYWVSEGREKVERRDYDTTIKVAKDETTVAGAKLVLKTNEPDSLFRMRGDNSSAICDKSTDARRRKRAGLR